MLRSGRERPGSASWDVCAGDAFDALLADELA
jgi:hypothetical protein